MSLTKDSYESIVENLHDGLYFVDRNRVITYWNKAAEQISGFTADEVVGKSCSDDILTHIDSDGNNLCTGMCSIVLETSRIRLREMTLNDLDDLHVILSDPIAMQHYPKPFDLPMTTGWIEWNLRNYAEYGFGLWAVIHKEDMRFIGDCGLTIQWVDDVDELEIGYHIMRSYWGRGLATEAASACRNYAFDVLRRQRVISWMHPENVASRRVAEKVGMGLEKGTINKSGRPAVVYSMTPVDRGQK